MKNQFNFILKCSPFVLLLLLSESASANAKDSLSRFTFRDYRPNIIQVEMIGNAGGPSINYERILKERSGEGLFLMRVGFGAFLGRVPKNFLGNYSIPLEFNWTTGEKHHLEGGFGLTSVFEDGYTTQKDKHMTLFVVPRIGYRYQAPVYLKPGYFVFRAGMSSLIHTKLDYLLLSPSVSFGFAF